MPLFFGAACARIIVSAYLANPPASSFDLVCWFWNKEKQLMANLTGFRKDHKGIFINKDPDANIEYSIEHVKDIAYSL